MDIIPKVDRSKTIRNTTAHLYRRQSNPVTIMYIYYDPLKRLREANYPNGDYYHYEYAAVGNRKRQTSFIGALTATII